MTFLATISLTAFPEPSESQAKLPTGGRLLGFTENWERSSPFLGSVLRSGGVGVRFLHEPPTPYDGGEPSFDETTNLVVDQMVQERDKLAI